MSGIRIEADFKNLGKYALDMKSGDKFAVLRVSDPEQPLTVDDMTSLINALIHARAAIR